LKVTPGNCSAVPSKSTRGDAADVAFYRLAGDGALAILVSAGVILTSTSLTGFSVQAWVT
jgi:hypothetical protein